MKFCGHSLNLTGFFSIFLILFLVATLLVYYGSFSSSLYKNGYGDLTSIESFSSHHEYGSEDSVSWMLASSVSPKKVEQEIEPQLEYELTRRRTEKRLREYEDYLNSQQKKLKKSIDGRHSKTGKLINDTLEKLGNHNRMLLKDLEQLKEVDGYESWREKESQELSEIVQLQLTKLQNPTNCSAARKLVCTVDRICGYGCELHHAVYCFLVSYMTNRTLILRMARWPYKEIEWEDVFLPVTNSCLSSKGSSVAKWPGSDTTQVVKLLLAKSSPKPASIEFAIPASLSKRLEKLHGEPLAWWVGQILKYFLKPQMKTRVLLEKAEKKMGFKKPIVGVHIRRSDKILAGEGKFHPLNEYMVHVEEYFKKLEIKSGVVKRRIYLTSDDPQVFNEARLRYPNYDIIGDPEVAKNASSSDSRYNASSLYGIIIDIHLLSRSDYLVCTFSSNVCRVAYEIMQQFYPDASQRVRSLEDNYYF